MTNTLASMSKVVIDSRPQRYDRVLFKRGARIHPSSFKIFGRPTEDGICLSDHYGVCATLRVTGIDTADIVPKTMAHEKSQLPDPTHGIKVIEDSTNLNPLIEPYLPTEADRKQREEALNLLQQTLLENKNLSNIILAPLESYCMETYFADLDVDVLAIASLSPQIFFDFELRSLDTEKDDANARFKGVHFVNSLVSIIEVSVLGIKFDIQYCQAPELLKRYVALRTRLSTPKFYQYYENTYTLPQILHKSRSPSSCPRPHHHLNPQPYLPPSPKHVPRHRLPPHHPPFSLLLPPSPPFPIPLSQIPRLVFR